MALNGVIGASSRQMEYRSVTIWYTTLPCVASLNLINRYEVLVFFS